VAAVPVRVGVGEQSVLMSRISMAEILGWSALPTEHTTFSTPSETVVMKTFSSAVNRAPTEAMMS